MMNEHLNPGGTHDGVGVLSDLTGLPRKSVFQIAAEVKANQKRLNDCLYHAFEPLPPIRLVNQRYRCTQCDGEVDFHAWHWHKQGRRPL